MVYRFQFLQLTLCILLLFCVGCGAGSSIGQVEGVVTFDGEPIDRATVSFYPTDARASIGVSDDQGHYKLTYTRSTKGALIGDHKVTVQTRIDREDDPPTSEYGGKGREEFLPPKYMDRRKTELTATVESGTNTIDFKLESN